MDEQKKRIETIVRKISQHPKMKFIAWRILGVIESEELYPIGLFGIQEYFNEVVQDIIMRERNK